MDTPTEPSLSFRLEGDVSVTVTVVEQADGTLLFTTTVDENDGQTADINGLFFDFAQPSLVDGLQADGEQVTKTVFDYDNIDNLGGGVNIKGDLVNDTDLFDGGVRFGTSGMAKDDIQSTSFTLSHEDVSLTLADVAGMDFGVRLTSVGEIDGAREDSLKLGGTAPEQTTPDRDKDKDDPFRLMGFGHRVYKNHDPRATVMKQSADEVLELLGIENNPTLQVAKELERIALADPYFAEKKLFPNVDFYSGIILDAMGFPTAMFTPIFALARTVGWISQWKEQISDPQHKIGRPRQLYLGETYRDYVDVENRG